MTQPDKSAGKFAWFCLGALLGKTGIPKVMHVIYITTIILLAIAAYSNVVPQLLE